MGGGRARLRKERKETHAASIHTRKTQMQARCRSWLRGYHPSRTAHTLTPHTHKEPTWWRMACNFSSLESRGAFGTARPNDGSKGGRSPRFGPIVPRGPGAVEGRRFASRTLALAALSSGGGSPPPPLSPLLPKPGRSVCSGLVTPE